MRRWLFGVMALMVGVALGAPSAAAQEDGVRVATPYPAVAVEAGERVTFDLEVTAPSLQRVDLEVTELPDEWQGTLRGGGFTVDGVFASDDPESPAETELELVVPPETPEGSYQVIVTATGDDSSDTLELTLRVAEVVTGGIALDAEFPTLRGTADQDFSFDLTLTNQTPDEVVVGLDAAAPEGWVVTARPRAEERAATATLEGGEDTRVVVDVEPPDRVEAGTYPILVRASGAGRTVETELEIEITGTVELTLTAPDERLNVDVRAGAPTEVSLALRNDGSAPLIDVELEAEPPADWDVQLSPATVAEVAPGDSVPVTATITPSAEAIAGDYLVTLTAESPERTDEVDLRATVEASRVGGVVGTLLILAALVGLVGVFQRYGRR